MNKEMLKTAKAKVMRCKPLRDALKDWFNHKGRCPFHEIPRFGDWVDRMFGYMADMIHDDGRVNAESLAAALRVQALGDPLALKLAKGLEKKNFQTDTNCYVEEGMVFASVWVKHTVLDYVKEKAEEVADKFRERGYSVDVWTDEEDASEITVNAVIDFDKFVKLQKKGGR